MSASHENAINETEPAGFASTEDLYTILATDTTATVELPGGLRVKVRGLTRHEHLWIGKGVDNDAAEIEARMMSKAMVEPALNLAAAKHFQEIAPSSVVSMITERIRDLSGFGQGAGKSAV